MGQIPCGLLCHAYVAMQLHRGHALEVGRQQVDGDHPSLKAPIGPVHERVRLDREILAAVPTAIGRRLAGRPLLDVQRAAARAVHAVWPASLDEPLLGNFVIREHPGQLYQRQAFAMSIPSAFCAIS